MFPDLTDGMLPPGVYDGSWSDVVETFGYNATRQVQLAGLRQLSLGLARAGCRAIWLDGSFVTDKGRPGDYDACWDPTGVDGGLVDPLLLNYPRTRAAAKAKYLGDIFINGVEGGSGMAFVDFFQVCRDGTAKGIIRFNPGEVS
ncbi:DUF6932 family protein [Nocardioides flavescens]|uniref:Uncharacterized protein n=1 Tax=Nocardioides flavescens TaxID=2691959 RepID=A0A6L7EW60_9ACTN|nr:hypothetical protein [Nocardioides flavescens]MXG88425.1 hypothetical protein [Nocardioides flavescens]